MIEPEFVSVRTAPEHPGIGTIALSRPPTNTFTRQMYRELAQAAAEVNARADIRVVIVYGDTRFSAPVTIWRNFRSYPPMRWRAVPVIGRLRLPRWRSWPNPRSPRSRGMRWAADWSWP